MSEKNKIEGDGFLFLCTSSYVSAALVALIQLKEAAL